MEETKKIRCNCHATGGGIYFLAFVGALVYYLQYATSFMDGVIGFLKSLVWPAILVYKLLELLAR
jgi:hypothetical protein